jgi:hypothetical protein
MPSRHCETWDSGDRLDPPDDDAARRMREHDVLRELAEVSARPPGKPGDDPAGPAGPGAAQLPGAQLE